MSLPMLVSADAASAAAVAAAISVCLYARTPCLLGWYEVQQLLLHALPKSTAVHLGAEFDQ
jgi:hypothetical protein